MTTTPSNKMQALYAALNKSKGGEATVLMKQLCVTMRLVMPYPKFEMVDSLLNKSMQTCACSMFLFPGYGYAQHALAKELYAALPDRDAMRNVGQKIHTAFCKQFDGAGLHYMRVIYYVIQTVSQIVDVTYFAFLRSSLSRAWDGVGDWKH